MYACQKDEYAFSYACDVTCYRCTLLKSILKAVHKPLMPLSDTNGCSAGNAHTAAAQRAARSRNLRHTCGKQHTWETRYLFMVDVQEQSALAKAKANEVKILIPSRDPSTGIIC